MDEKLVAWARAVKSVHAFVPSLTSLRGCTPVLWLFTDAARLPDPRAAVARLPKGRCGVVLRHDGVPDRARLGRDLARICRMRRLALVVAGDTRLAASLGAGVHLRGGRRDGPRALRNPMRSTPARSAMVTSSAHNLRELRRAARAGADLAFLSPVFPTASHPGAVALGVLRWTRLAMRGGLPVAALGGIDARNVRALPRSLCRGAGAIGAII